MLGILASGIMASRLYNVQPGLSWYIILFLTAWCIYLTDHLMDGFRLKGAATNKRHLFFYKNRRIILILLLFLIACDAFLTWTFLPFRFICIGSVLGLLVILYLWAIKFAGTLSYLVFPKEILVGILYTAGIWGFPFLLIGEKQLFPDLIPLFIFFLIVVTNLFLYSWFEQDQDRADLQKSLLVYAGQRISIIIVRTWLAFSVFCNLTFLWMYFYDVRFLFCTIIFLTMQMLQVLLFTYRHTTWCQLQYRWINESIFFLPALMILT